MGSVDQNRWKNSICFVQTGIEVWSQVIFWFEKYYSCLHLGAYSLNLQPCIEGFCTMMFLCGFMYKQQSVQARSLTVLCLWKSQCSHYWSSQLSHRQRLPQEAAGSARVLTLSESSSILVVSCTSGALGTTTGMGGRVLPKVPIDAVFTEWTGWEGA